MSGARLRLLQLASAATSSGLLPRVVTQLTTLREFCSQQAARQLASAGSAGACKQHVQGGGSSSSSSIPGASAPRASSSAAAAAAQAAGSAGAEAAAGGDAAQPLPSPPGAGGVAKGWVQNPPQDPWTPTRLLRKRNFLPRRMGHLMQVLEAEEQGKVAAARGHPNFAVGDLLELKLAVPENKGKPAVVRGVCIGRRNRAVRSSFSLLNHIAGGGAVERSFPLYCPSIQELKVIGKSRVRVNRAKLTFLRKAPPKAYTV